MEDCVPHDTLQCEQCVTAGLLSPGGRSAVVGLLDAAARAYNSLCMVHVVGC